MSSIFVMSSSVSSASPVSPVSPVSSMVPANPTTKFEDFDLDEVFQKATPHTANLNSKNFVVEFGPERARIAFDLDAAGIEKVLEGERDTKDYPIRWMYVIPPPPFLLMSSCSCILIFASRNIWNPSTQHKSVAAIGKHYDFSERLVRLMYLTARRRQPEGPRKPKERMGLKARHRRRHLDVEAGNGGDGINGSYPLESRTNAQPTKEEDDENQMDFVDDDSMDLYLQVQSTVNYFSTDQTQKGACSSSDTVKKKKKLLTESKKLCVSAPTGYINDQKGSRNTRATA